MQRDEIEIRRDETRTRTRTRMSPHCVGILGLDRDERFAIAKSNWDYEGRTDGRRIDWRKLATTGGTIYMRTKSHAGTIGNVLHYSTTKRYVAKGSILLQEQGGVMACGRGPP